MLSFLCLFIYLRLNDAVGSSEYIASNNWMVSEGKIGKEVEGSDHDLICCSVATFVWRD
jgi:hypothetical protein